MGAGEEILMKISVRISSGWTSGEIIEKRKYTCLVRLPDGTTIVRRWRDVGGAEKVQEAGKACPVRRSAFKKILKFALDKLPLSRDIIKLMDRLTTRYKRKGR